MEIFCEQKVITVISVAGCSVAGQAKQRSLHIRLLRLTSQNYVISHWVVYYDVKYNELNEAFTVFSNLFQT